MNQKIKIDSRKYRSIEGHINYDKMILEILRNKNLMKNRRVKRIIEEWICSSTDYALTSYEAMKKIEKVKDLIEIVN